MNKYDKNKITLEYITLKPFVGIDKKIHGQLEALKEYGITGSPFYITKKMLLAYLVAFRRIVNSKADVIYIRNLGPFMFLLTPALIKVQTHKILILEIPTPLFSMYYEIKNKKTNKLIKLIRLLSFRLSFPLVLRYFDIIVEYGTEDIKYSRGIENKITYITNGISLKEIPLKRKHYPRESLHIIGVANIAFWHGYDRVIKGLHKYYLSKNSSDNNVYFHIVGEGPEKSSLIKLVRKYGIDKYVIFYGKKTGTELKKIYEICDIAVGSLGLHRENFTTAATLKSREYCALGIPFLLAGKDPDFPESLPFVFYVSSTDKPIDIKKIFEFKTEVYKYMPKLSIIMKVYAKRQLIWKKKMKKIITRLLALYEIKTASFKGF